MFQSLRTLILVALFVLLVSAMGASAAAVDVAGGTIQVFSAAEAFPPPEPMPAPAASFDNRFAGVGDLPCRKLFRRTMAGRTVAPPSALEWAEYKLGVDSARLEFSSFWHVPTHVERYAECVQRHGTAFMLAVLALLLHALLEP